MTADFGDNALTSPQGAGVYPRCNFGAGGAPTATDDSDAGYGVGSIWTTATAGYMCLDASVGAAVWKQVTL